MKAMPLFSIPEAFWNALEVNHLPLPPLPGPLLRHIRQVDDYAFSTHDSWLPVMNGRLSLPDAPWSGEPYFACGLTGYGLQNWRYYYALLTDSLELAVLCPYPGVFGSARPARAIPQAHTLLHACLRATRCGERLGSPATVRLRVTLDGDDFAFGIYDRAGNVIRGGVRPEFLLDMLARWEQGLAPAPADYA